MSPSTIVEFWFEQAGPKKWFLKDDAFDAQIKSRFEKLIHGIADEINQNGKADWEDDSEGALAAIIVLDQFPRNIYRDTPQSFAYDPMALAMSNRVIEQGLDKPLSETQRHFIYMPFMHSEVLSDQDVCVAYFESTGNQVTLEHAQDHRGLIRRFGRFPHRNTILGRISTQEEKKFLDAGGYAP